MGCLCCPISVIWRTSSNSVWIAGAGRSIGSRTRSPGQSRRSSCAWTGQGEKRLVEEQERVRAAETRIRAALAAADSRVEMAVAAERRASQQTKEEMDQCVSAEKARTKEVQNAYDEAKRTIESLHDARERQTKTVSDLQSQIEVLEVSVQLKLDVRGKGETTHRQYGRQGRRG